MTTENVLVHGATVSDRRELILDAAVRCIAERGYDAVRLRDVSRAAGVSIGLVQHYFDSRNELIDTAISYASGRMIATWNGDLRTSGSPEQQLREAILLLARRDDLWLRSAIWLEFARTAARHEHIRAAYVEVYSAWERQFSSILEAGIADGTFEPPMAANDAVRSLLSFFDGFELEIATGVIPVDASVFENRCLAVALTLFGVRSAR